MICSKLRSKTRSCKITFTTSTICSWICDCTLPTLFQNLRHWHVDDGIDFFHGLRHGRVDNDALLREGPRHTLRPWHSDGDVLQDRLRDALLADHRLGACHPGLQSSWSGVVLFFSRRCLRRCEAPSCFAPCAAAHIKFRKKKHTKGKASLQWNLVLRLCLLDISLRLTFSPSSSSTLSILRAHAPSPVPTFL